MFFFVSTRLVVAIGSLFQIQSQCLWNAMFVALQVNVISFYLHSWQILSRDEFTLQLDRCLLYLNVKRKQTNQTLQDPAVQIGQARFPPLTRVDSCINIEPIISKCLQFVNKSASQCPRATWEIRGFRAWRVMHAQLTCQDQFIGSKRNGLSYYLNW